MSQKQLAFEVPLLIGAPLQSLRVTHRRSGDQVASEPPGDRLWKKQRPGSVSVSGLSSSSESSEKGGTQLPSLPPTAP